jgi:hypothetical protein
MIERRRGTGRRRRRSLHGTGDNLSSSQPGCSQVAYSRSGCGEETAFDSARVPRPARPARSASWREVPSADAHTPGGESVPKGTMADVSAGRDGLAHSRGGGTTRRRDRGPRPTTRRLSNVQVLLERSPAHPPGALLGPPWDQLYPAREENHFGCEKTHPNGDLKSIDITVSPL